MNKPLERAPKLSTATYAKETVTTGMHRRRGTAGERHGKLVGEFGVAVLAGLRHLQVRDDAGEACTHSMAHEVTNVRRNL